MLRFLASFLAAVLAVAAIVPPTAASAQSNARTGCLNQWLFNGVWRAKITKVEPIMDGAAQTGWRVTQVWRNGTSGELAPADSALKDMYLHLSNSDLEVEEHNIQALTFNAIAPSGENNYTAVFYGPNMRVDPNDKPKGLDVTFDNKVVSTSNKPHFSSRQYNFHYNLGCVASGAAAQAQGGSTQLNAVNGCMNQWMSNGVWKMRVLAVTPFPVGTTARNQFGWHVRQEWVNILPYKVQPRGFDEGNHVSPTSVSDEFLAMKSGSNISSANVVGGFGLGQRNIPFLPGVPYTFEQLISGGLFNAADPPVRLLVTFDTDTQKKIKLTIPVPRYRMPANFRISLLCGGTVTMAPGLEELNTPTPAQPAAMTQPAPAAQSATQSQQVASAQAPQSSGSNLKVDPCAMLGAPDVASALGVGVGSLGTAQHPSANECAWAVASHAGTPARSVLLTLQPVQAAQGCHGLSCLHVVQSVMGIPGVPNLPPAMSSAFTDAQILSGLGDKAAWKDGKLTVLKADMAFQLLVLGSHSPALATSESLARTVLYHLSP